MCPEISPYQVQSDRRFIAFRAKTSGVYLNLTRHDLIYPRSARWCCLPLSIYLNR